MRLIVHLAVDQLRPDRIHQELPGGLGRLMRAGRVYQQATLDHGVTNTCPGHAVMLTGANPYRHGVVSNDMMDRDSWQQVYCVQDDAEEAAGLHNVNIGRSPRRITATALGDWLKKADPGSRVYAMAQKDRAAITLGGQHADGVYWFDRELGLMTSSRYYVNHPSELPLVIQSFNRDANGQNFLAQLPDQWEHAPGDYRADDFPAEDPEFSRFSPHPLGKADEVSERAEQFYVSPFGDSSIASLAQALVTEKQLGQRDAPDLLALSFAAVDTLGHRHGPFSGEVSAAIENLDQELASLFSFLDSTVGADHYVVSLTSDHGVLSLPEWQQGNPDPKCAADNGRTSLAGLAMRLYARLFFEFLLPWGNPLKLVRSTGNHLYINHQYAHDRGIDPDEVAEYLEKYLEASPHVHEVWRPEELPSDRAFAREYANSYHPVNSGDVILQTAEGCLIRGSHGTDHGSAWDYDRRIPLIFYGPGIAAGHLDAEAHSIDIAPTWAAWIGVATPEDLDGQVLSLQDQIPARP